MNWLELTVEEVRQQLTKGAQLSALEMAIVFDDIKNKIPVPYWFPKRFRKGVVKALKKSIKQAKKDDKPSLVVMLKKVVKHAKRADQFHTEDYFNSQASIHFIRRGERICTLSQVSAKE